MFGRNLKTRLDLIRPNHHNIIQNKQQTQIEQCKGRPTDFDIGSEVYARNPLHAFDSPWIPGSIVNKTGNVSYDVKVGTDKIIKRHSNQLRSRKSLSAPTQNLDTQSESEEHETDNANPAATETIIISDDETDNANQAATETIIISDDDNSNYDTHEPSVSHRYNLRSSPPDFLAFVITLLMMLLLAAGVKKSLIFNNILNAINLAVWVFVMSAGLFYVDSDNWSKHQGFLPYGWSGLNMRHTMISCSAGTLLWATLIACYLHAGYSIAASDDTSLSKSGDEANQQ
ncbi:hypothetical protein QE152_g17035, partial [Popillia japonica]